MTYNERNEILQNSEYVGRVRIAFCDWLQYWATNGLNNIEDENQKELTGLLIKLSLQNPDIYVNKLANLAISEPSVKDAIEITDENISIAVTHILATALSFLM